MSLSDRIKQRLRDVDGLTQAGLARACRISRPSVSAWTTGKVHHLLGENLLLAARYLGVRPDWLATGNGPMFFDTADGTGQHSPTDGRAQMEPTASDVIAKITPQQALLVLQQEVVKRHTDASQQWPFTSVKLDEWMALDFDSRNDIESVINIMIRSHSKTEPLKA